MKKNCICPVKKRIVNKPFRDYYRKETKNIKHLRLHEYDNDRIIQLFMKKVSEGIVENRAGVHINKIGYFFVYRHPFEFPPTINGKHHLKRYMPTFIPTENSIFKYWSMDFKFERPIYARIDSKIKEGYRYLNLMLGVTKRDYMYLGAAKKAIRYKTLREKKYVI